MIQNNNNKSSLAGQFSIHLGTAAGVSKHGSVSRCSGRSSPYVICEGSWLYQHQSPLRTAHSKDHCRQIKGLETCTSNPGHLWLEPPVFCHWATTVGRPPTLTILYMFCIYSFISSMRQDALSILEWENHSAWVLSWSMERISGQLLTDFWWHMLSGCQGVWLRHSVPPVQYILRVVRIGGHPAIVAQWQSTGGSSQRCPGFDSRLAGLFTFLYFCLLANI